MKNKMVIIIVVVVLLAAGAASYFFFFKKEKDPADAPKDPKKEYVTEEWNPYAEDKHHNSPIQDMLLSAANGEYVIKMNLTLGFKDLESLDKFNGKSTPSYLDEEGEEAGHGEAPAEGEAAHATPMNIKINSLISTFMIQAEPALIEDKEKIETELKLYLNTKLDLGEDFIKEIYIDSYIIQ